MSNFFPKLVVLSFRKLGTEIDLRIVVSEKKQEQVARRDLLEAEKIYEKYHLMFSRFERENELARLNAELGSFREAKPEILEIAGKCLSYNKMTQGYFDPRIICFLENCGYDRDFESLDFSEKRYGGTSKIIKSLGEDLKIEGGRILLLERVDFSGIAKGWITDRVADFLLGRGWKNFVVDSGGDMYFSGLNEKLEKWTVDIAGIPFEKLTLGFLNKAIATSGIGKRKWENGGGRFHHLINPKDPEDFSFDLKSVTVIADSVEEADVWAKTLFLMGKEKGIVYARKNSIGSIFLDYKGNAGISPAINGYKI